MDEWNKHESLEYSKNHVLFIDKQIKLTRQALLEWLDQRKKEEAHIQWLTELIRKEGP